MKIYSVSFAALSILASGFGFLAPSPGLQEVTGQEARSVFGGADVCKDVYNGTCGNGQDAECSAASCLVENKNGEVAVENQEVGTGTVCGDNDCGRVYTTSDCDN